MPEISTSFLIVALYATVAFVPLVPTLLIYWLFPKKNKLVVKGPFAGLSFRAGGAIGAYVLLLAGVYTVLVPKMEARMDGYDKRLDRIQDQQHADREKEQERLDRLQADLWTFKADVKFRKADGTDLPILPLEFRNKLRVVSPNTYRFDSYGATIKFKRVDGDFPDITIESPGFPEQSILLRSFPPSKMTIDPLKRTVTMKEPIVLQIGSTGGAVQAAASPTPRSEDSADRPH